MNPEQADAKVLAIDGPGGAGKSTVSDLVARRLGMRRLDTGAIYRAVTSAVLHAGAVATDAAACAAIAERAHVELSDGTVAVDGRDVTTEIRGPAVTEAVPVVSAHPGVRRALVALQRQVAAKGSWVVEGRDIGTVVFPDAALKVFLTASAQERARRRAAEFGETDLARVESEIRRRDLADSTRTDSPLRPADDAVTVVSDGLTAEEVADTIAELWRQRWATPDRPRTAP
ncbi:MAG: (d)CMP kinase [Acidimicrobiia bacterium]